MEKTQCVCFCSKSFHSILSGRWMPKLKFVEHVGKESACRARDTRDTGLIPDLEKSPREGYSKPLQILAWRILWTEDPGRLQSVGSLRVSHD